MSQIPGFLEEKLREQYGTKLTLNIIQGYEEKRNVTLRVNKLKSNNIKIKQILNENKIQFEEVSWYEDALILNNCEEKDIRKLSIYENGEIYLQSLSSMIPAIIMEPKEDENILDMTAAPGGKTVQMSAISENKALITACEKNKIRGEKLKFNIQKQGANRVNVLLQDARNLNEYFSFDKILLDAPCSGSGTIYLRNENIREIFTEELVNRSVKVQTALLKKALTILKPGHEMVYSTCSILEEENENNIKDFIRKNQIEIIPIDVEKFKEVELLPTKIKGTICICPTKHYEGFFVAKFKKK